MIIMIISFRVKTKRIFRMKRIHTKKEDESSSFSVPLLLGGARGGLSLFHFPQGLIVITLLYDSGFTLYSSST